MSTGAVSGATYIGGGSVLTTALFVVFAVVFVGGLAYSASPRHAGTPRTCAGGCGRHRAPVCDAFVAGRRESLRALEQFPRLGTALGTDGWAGFRFVLGPWRWMVVAYEILDDGARVVIVTVQDGRSSAAADG